MNVLVTGAGGFVGKNLVETLKTIRDNKKRIDKIYEYDRNNTLEDLDRFCKDCDFVFNLAGVNRPKDNSEFMEGNFGFASDLLDTLKRNNNKCPVMLSSSIQASLSGRFGDSEYGRSKLAGEELFFKYAEETGAKVLVYRFPNLYGKWCRPNCDAFANDKPYTVNDPNVELELLYIDDLVDEMLRALEGKEHRDDKFCYAPVTHKVTLGRIVEILEEFKAQPTSLLFTSILSRRDCTVLTYHIYHMKKLYST